MDDLNYLGEEPTWEKMELLDRVSAADNDNDVSEAG